MVGRPSMEQAREIRAQRELAQELGTWLGSLSGYTRLFGAFNLPDDVQQFERAIVSGQPFKTESPNRRLAKSRGSNVDNANDGSGPGSESESADHEPPKMVSCNSIHVLSISDLRQNNARRKYYGIPCTEDPELRRRMSFTFPAPLFVSYVCCGFLLASRLIAL